VSAAATPAVEARGLAKRYGSAVAVDQLDLTVEPGDVYGFLGPNGAGKTTSLRMMLGLIRPTAGRVLIHGIDPMDDPVGSLRGVAGFVEQPTFYPYLSGRANLELLATLDGGCEPRAIDDVLDQVELSDRAGDRVGGYSHGMGQRLGIAAALLRRPRLLLLDEPTTGLDPAGMRDMRALVARLAASGITILLSSHLLGEVEHLCTRVAIVHRGRVRYEGDLPRLPQGRGLYRLVATDPAAAAAMCGRLEGISDVHAHPDAVSFTATPESAGELSLALAAEGIGVQALVPGGTALEQLFFRLTDEDAE